MEETEKGLKGGAFFYVDHQLDIREGDPVDRAQGDLLEVPQWQPVDPHTALATQDL
jgi:hypothetical protein